VSRIVEIPLSLRSPSPDRLVYAVPRWFRACMAAILAFLVAGLVLGGKPPGALAWVMLALAAVGALYEERWVFDAGAGRIVQRVGLRLAYRSMVIPFDAIEGFRIIPVVAGTIPGSQDEAAENVAALAGTATVDSRGRRARHKKPFLDLVVECLDGTRYLIDHRPARCAAQLRDVANQLAAHCDRPLEEG